MPDGPIQVGVDLGGRGIIKKTRRCASVEHERDPAIELPDDLLGRPRVGLAGPIRARNRKTAAARRDEPPRQRMVWYAERHRAAARRHKDDGERTGPETLREGA